MKRIILLLLLSTFWHLTYSQNWQTVYPHDTNYYNAGKISLNNSYYAAVLLGDSNLLRAMWVDSTTVIGGDSIFYFFRGFRIADTATKCLDTSAPSWLGPHLIRRQQDGRELYFNSYGDTISFMTRASVGSSWVLAKDISGKVFQGNVTAAGTELVDGVIDSTKTISIQAFNNGVPVPDSYNSSIFRLSKSHGWLKTLDLFRFPNKLPSGYIQDVINSDSMQHERMPKRFANLDIQHVDLAWKYAAGNDFINSKITCPGGRVNAYDTLLTYDSVITSNVVAPTTAIVNFFTIRHSAKWYLRDQYHRDSLVTSTSSYFHTDTIVANTSSKLVRSFPVGESLMTLPSPKGVYFTTNCNRHLVDTLANGLFSYEPDIIGGVLFYNSSNCWGAYGFTSSNQLVRSTNYVENFGIRRSFISMPWVTASSSDTIVDVVYANMPGLRWGNKARIAALQVNTQRTTPGTSFAMYPNPASERVTVTSTSPEAIDAQIVDFSGKLVLQSNGYGKLELITKDISSGFYFLEVSTKEQRQVFKLVIQR